MLIANLISMVGFALEISARKCGFPDEPYNSIVSSEKDVYLENEQVTNKCNNGYYAVQDDKLVKEVNRTCQCNGVWSGIAPGCDYFNYIDKNKMRGTYSRALDDDDESYETLSLSSWRYVSEVAVDLYSGSPITLLVSILYEATASQFKMKILFWESQRWSECSSSSDPTPPGTKGYRLISCNLGSRPDILRIEFSRTQASQPADVQVYTLRVLGRITMKCGSPAKILNGNVALNGGYADYSCNHGYTLFGSKRSTCVYTSYNSYWSTERHPICVSVEEKGCRQLPKVEYGLLVLTNPTCPTDYNIRDHSDVAVLHCEHGFRRKIKNPFAYCNDSTDWTWKLDGQPLHNQNICLPPANLTDSSSSVTKQDNPSSTISICFFAVGVVLTILCLLYCLFSCWRKKLQLRKTRQKHNELGNPGNESLPGPTNSQNQRPTDVPLTVLNRTTSDAPSSLGESNIYAEISEASPPFQPSSISNLQCNETYAVIIPSRPQEGGSCGENLYNNIEPPYASFPVALKKQSSRATPKDATSVPHTFVNNEPYAKVVKISKKKARSP